SKGTLYREADDMEENRVQDEAPTSALLRFLQRNQITKSRPLPLVHTTESYYLKKIIETGQIKAQRCNVFAGEQLSYFFVGRAAYKRDSLQECEYWELPT